MILKFINIIIDFFKFSIKNRTLGDKALQDAAILILSSLQRRNKLRNNGWIRIDPPLINNQWVWHHKRWFSQLENKAIELTDGL